MPEKIDPIVTVRDVLRDAGFDAKSIQRFTYRPPIPIALIGSKPVAKESILRKYLADLEAQLTPRR